MISPTIGRVVWFQPAHAEGTAELHQPHAALVTYVHSDTCINVGGFDANGKPFSACSVILLQDHATAPAHGHYAQWMPFQKVQAAKHEAEKKDAAGHTQQAAAQAVTGNFQLSANLPNGKSLSISGYIFDGESRESLDARLDILGAVVDRQRTIAEIPELELKVAASIDRLDELRAHYKVLLDKKEARGAKTLSSQEKSALDVMDVNVNHQLEQIEKGKRAVAEAKAKVGQA